MPSYNRRIELPGRSSQELYDKVSQEIDRLLQKIAGDRFDVQRDAGAKTIHVKSGMFNASLACEEGALRLDAQLSLFAAPFRGKIDDGIDRWVTKTFNA